MFWARGGEGAGRTGLSPSPPMPVRSRASAHAHQRRRPFVPPHAPNCSWAFANARRGLSTPRCAWRVVLSAGASACGIAPHASRVPGVRRTRGWSAQLGSTAHTAATKHAAAGHPAAAAAAAGNSPCCNPARLWRTDLREQQRFSPRRSTPPGCRGSDIRAVRRHGERDSAPCSTVVCVHGAPLVLEPPHVPTDATEGQRRPGAARAEAQGPA